MCDEGTDPHRTNQVTYRWRRAWLLHLHRQERPHSFRSRSKNLRTRASDAYALDTFARQGVYQGPIWLQVHCTNRPDCGSANLWWSIEIRAWRRNVSAVHQEWGKNKGGNQARPRNVMHIKRGFIEDRAVVIRVVLRNRCSIFIWVNIITGRWGGDI